MIAEHEAIVASRFDALHERFKSVVDEDDPRLLGIIEAFLPLDGRTVLDLGCGKGRFGRALERRGAQVVGLDVSEAMLRPAVGIGLGRIRGTARRLPFSSASLDHVLAVEVFEHLATEAIEEVLKEVRRVLRPGGIFAVVDKSVYSLNARRPWLPSVLVKRIDEFRGFWMYSHRGPVREHWFRPEELRRRLERWFGIVRIVHILSREERGLLFRLIPSTRLLVLWTAQVPGGAR
jgi:2-polyprenyl-6-hydroxyphenyl methylase/3-demethylubiquinone-9 3-methyltransferase